MNRSIFISGVMPATGQVLPTSMPIFTRGMDLTSNKAHELVARAGEIERAGGNSADVMKLLADVAGQMGSLERAMNSSNIPVRENLEAEAKILVPMETPLRNRLKRRPGSGIASNWKQITSLGGGYGYASTTSGSGNVATSTTVVVGSVAGLVVGDVVMIGIFPTNEQKTITAINAGTTTLTLNSALANTQNSKPVVKVSFQPGGGSAVRSFFSESGAPAQYSTVYTPQSQAFKLLGAMGSVTGFAMAAGATFQNQLAVEKANQIRNTMLNEENALTNSDAASILAPWGDGTNALGFNGIVNSISTANGTPAVQIQVNVGQLTTAHIDAQIIRLWMQGGQNIFMMLSGQEIQSLVKIANSGGSLRIILDQTNAKLGASVKGYIHPITGETIEILPSRFLQPGTIIFGCDRLPDGSDAHDVEVLPQVQLPELAPNEDVQGYVAQELAPSKDAPQEYPFIVSVFEVYRMKSALHFAKSTGVTPA